MATLTLKPLKSAQITGVTMVSLGLRFCFPALTAEE
jgi:hypothetical protein